MGPYNLNTASKGIRNCPWELLVTVSKEHGYLVWTVVIPQRKLMEYLCLPSSPVQIPTRLAKTALCSGAWTGIPKANVWEDSLGSCWWDVALISWHWCPECSYLCSVGPPSRGFTSSNSLPATCCADTQQRSDFSIIWHSASGLLLAAPSVCSREAQTVVT